MAGWRPLKRRDFIRKLGALGFVGPYSGTRHQFMVFGPYHQTIPNNVEYSVPQLRMLLRQIEAILQRKITLDEWAKL
jgi:hypothetical protein